MTVNWPALVATLRTISADPSVRASVRASKPGRWSR